MSSKRPKVDMPTALGLLVPARLTREKMHQDGHDFAPMIVFAPRRGQAVMAVLEGEGTFAENLNATLFEIRSSLGPAEWIAVTTDAYARKVDSEPDARAHVPGTLASAFAAGDPDVTEQMVVVLKHRYKPSEMATQTYRYTPVDGFEWDEPEETAEMEGGTVEVLNFYI